MDELDQKRRDDVNVFPAPREGTELGVNPDGFVWLPVDGAERYELLVEDCETGETVLQERVGSHYYVPRGAFPAGEYAWELRAYDGDGAPLGRREPWSFTVPEDAPVSVPPPAESVLDAVPDEHPRLVFPGDGLAETRAWLHKEGDRELAELEEWVERAYEMGMPPEPEYHHRETEQERRQYYKEFYSEYRQYVDRNLRATALYHLLTGDERAGEFAADALLCICDRNPEGPNSVERFWYDEPGLSHARILHHAYDWTYDCYDGVEREYVERTLAAYARQTYDRLRDGDFMTRPSTSHPARLPGHLGEQAILLHERLPEAVEMLQYALDVFDTFYPYWGGTDGGWAEGPTYGQGYNRNHYPPFFTTLERLTGFSLWDRPFYRNVGDFFVYFAPPNAENIPFGDAQDKGRTGNGLKTMLQFYGTVYDDPALRWRASQFEGSGVNVYGLLSFLARPERGEVDPETVDLPDSAVFRDVGWAALHSDVTTPDEDTYVAFRSSPYGNVSHSRNNQNAFCIQSGGRALAIASGYRPQHGSPHHEEWTQRTKAHNSILVDGEGQERGIDATGRIGAFDDGEGFSYVRGEAAGAYGGRLDRFDRHVLFVDPGLVLVYDDLAAPTSSAYTWLLHAHEEPTVDASNRRIDVTREPARMRTRLFADADLSFSTTEGFDPPPNEGILDELSQEYPTQYHVAAETPPEESAKLLAVASVRPDGAVPDVTYERQGDVVRIESDRFSGEVVVGSGPASITGTVEGADGTTEQVEFP